MKQLSRLARIVPRWFDYPVGVVGVLVGAVLLATALVGIGTAYWIGLSDGEAEANLHRAVTLAAQRVQALRVKGYENLTPGTITEQEIDGYPGFTCVTTIEDGIPNPGAKRVTVRVTGSLPAPVRMRTVIPR